MRLVLGALGLVSVMSAAVGISLQPAEASISQAQPVVAVFADTSAPAAAAEPAVYHLSAPSPDDEFLLAATMWGEARSEGKIGMGYVGHVIVNRSRAGFRGRTVSEVARYRRQFSCWNRSDPNRPKLSRAYLESSTGIERQRWDEAKYLAHFILRGSDDYTGGALHYHTTSIDPAWSGDYEVTRTLGHHVFYR